MDERRATMSLYIPDNTDLDFDFIGFSFGDYHFPSSDPDLASVYRVSDGNRYNDNIIPTIQDKSVQKPGSDGTLYWESFHTQRTFSVNIAFDGLTETGYRKLRQIFNGKDVQRLIFDEAPYKYYKAKVQSPPQLKTICFEEDGVRIYKGEGTIQFICYDPYGHCPADKKYWGTGMYQIPDSLTEQSVLDFAHNTYYWYDTNENEYVAYNGNDVDTTGKLAQTYEAKTARDIQWAIKQEDGKEYPISKAQNVLIFKERVDLIIDSKSMSNEGSMYLQFAVPLGYPSRRELVDAYKTQTNYDLSWAEYVRTADLTARMGYIPVRNYGDLCVKTNDSKDVILSNLESGEKKYYWKESGTGKLIGYAIAQYNSGQYRPPYYERRGPIFIKEDGEYLLYGGDDLTTQNLLGYRVYQWGINKEYYTYNSRTKKYVLFEKNYLERTQTITLEGGNYYEKAIDTPPFQFMRLSGASDSIDTIIERFNKKQIWVFKELIDKIHEKGTTDRNGVKYIYDYVKFTDGTYNYRTVQRVRCAIENRTDDPNERIKVVRLRGPVGYPVDEAWCTIDEATNPIEQKNQYIDQKPVYSDCYISNQLVHWERTLVPTLDSRRDVKQYYVEVTNTETQQEEMWKYEDSSDPVRIGELFPEDQLIYEIEDIKFGQAGVTPWVTLYPTEHPIELERYKTRRYNTGTIKTRLFEPTTTYNYNDRDYFTSLSDNPNSLGYSILKNIGSSTDYYLPTVDNAPATNRTYYTYDETNNTYVEFTGKQFVPGTTYYVRNLFIRSTTGRNDNSNYIPRLLWDAYPIQQYPTRNQWIPSSGLLETRGKFDIGLQTQIELYNPGDIPVGICIVIYKGRVQQLSKLTLTQGGQIIGQMTFQDFILSNANLGSDLGIIVNSTTNLIEGYSEWGGTVENSTLSGKLYNKYLLAGDFFKVPVGESTLSISGISREFEITPGSTSSIDPVISAVSYEYLYY